MVTGQPAPQYLVPFQAARERLMGLTLFRDVLADEVGQAMHALIAGLCESGGRTLLSEQYARMFALLAEEGELQSKPHLGDAWQNHLLERMLDSVNAFSRKAEHSAIDGMGHALIDQAARDLRALQALHALDTNHVRTAMVEATATAQDAWVPWAGFRPLTGGLAEGQESLRDKMKHTLVTVSDWGAMVEPLAEFYRQAGTGDFGHFRAFRWIAKDDSGRLAGVPWPDPIRLQELIGYEMEREPVVKNTRQFVAGHTANNVLLYGEQGTGKSSTVKALLNEHAHDGLRLIEVAKEDLEDFPRIIAEVRGRPERFILFVDDLSFEEQETHYKALKAILEGGLEVRPDNVLLYATSNRRHLIKERFGDRGAPGDDDVNIQDTVEEKVSLAARFGLQITFMAPGQERFLTIVEALAATRGLAIESKALREKAIAWAQWQNGRTGRTARQFIDHLAGELAMEKQAR